MNDRISVFRSSMHELIALLYTATYNRLEKYWLMSQKNQMLNSFPFNSNSFCSIFFQFQFQFLSFKIFQFQFRSDSGFGLELINSNSFGIDPSPGCDGKNRGALRTTRVRQFCTRWNLAKSFLAMLFSSQLQ